MAENKNVFTALFDALRTINDNLLVLSENLAETDRKAQEIRNLLTDTAAPMEPRTAKKKTGADL